MKTLVAEPISKTLSPSSGLSAGPDVSIGDDAAGGPFQEPDHDPGAAPGIHALLEDRLDVGVGREQLGGPEPRREGSAVERKTRSGRTFVFAPSPGVQSTDLDLDGPDPIRVTPQAKTFVSTWPRDATVPSKRPACVAISAPPEPRAMTLNRHLLPSTSSEQWFRPVIVTRIPGGC